MKTVRHIKGTNDLATFMPKAGEASHNDPYLFVDREQSDDIDRKQASGGYLMVDGSHRAACLQLQTQRSHEFEWVAEGRQVGAVQSRVLATFRSEPPPLLPGKTVDFGTDPRPMSMTVDLP